MPVEVGKSDDPRLCAAIETWLEADKNDETRTEIEQLVEDSRWDELTKLLCGGRLHFGTAGLRGPMRAGYACMNDLVVLQTAQGLCAYLKAAATPETLANGVIVGYDGRHNSERFAELTAHVFVQSNIKVCLFGDVCPTPWVSFAIGLYGAAAGVMVTASHNPKEDNGYKVYWSNAAQIIAPHDKNIEEAILQNTAVDDSLWNVDDIRRNPLVVDNLEEVTVEYLKTLRENITDEDIEGISTAQVQFVYSAMHGVGFPYIHRAFKHVGIQPVIPVSEQCYPDPNFPTVQFPNPEEPASLMMSLKLAEEEKCNIILANDPDADRLAIAEYQPNTQSWHVFTGNEAGTLLGWWVLRSFQLQNPDVDPSSIVMLASAVSSKMLRAVCATVGATFIETLTGFKWMGGLACTLLKENKHPVFAFEEAIGFMCGSAVPDKDGISAAVHVASLSSYLRLQNKNLLEHLHSLFAEYGYHLTNNSYFISYKKEIFERIFENLRNYKGTRDYPTSLRDWSIVKVRDLGVKGDDMALNGTGLDKPLSSGQMLTFSFENGLVATIRTSGTEPKIKYYSELCAKPDQGDRMELDTLLNDMVDALVEDFLEPKANGLIDRK